MKQTKLTSKIISILLSLSLASSFCVIPAFAVEEMDSSDSLRVEGVHADGDALKGKESGSLDGYASLATTDDAVSSYQTDSGSPDTPAHASSADADASSTSVLGEDGESSDAFQGSDAERVLAQDSLEFIYVDADVVHVGEKQYIAVALSEDYESPESATLCVDRISDGTVLHFQATNIVGASALFELDFDLDADIGSYALSQLRFSYDEREYYIDLRLDTLETVSAILEEADDGQSTVIESVETDVHDISPAGAPIYAFEVQAAVLEDNSVDNPAGGEQLAVLALEEDESLAQVSDIQEGLSIADGSVSEPMSSNQGPIVQDGIDGKVVNQNSSSVIDAIFGVETAYAIPVKRFVIALDPGHGGYDGGATYSGLREKDVNLRIAQYCRDALESIPGVSVYMTRTDDTYVALSSRVIDSVDHGADAVISIHCNASGSHASTGSEVWVPNTSSWKYDETHVTGYDLGSQILDQLVALGLNRRGVFTRDCTTGDTYADGSLMDYYTIVSKSREYGIPGIIVEHAFIDCDPDASRLADDAFLKQLGEADARGIISYYGLDGSKPFVEDIAMENGSITLSWSPIDGAARYAIARVTQRSDGSYSYDTYTYDCTDCSFTVTGLENGEEYAFLVQACVDGKWNPFATRDYVRCKLVPPPCPSVDSVGNGTVTLSWDPIDGAERYAIAEFVDGKYITYSYDCTDTSFTVSNISNGTEHAFLVQASVNDSWSLFTTADHIYAVPNGPTRPVPAAEAGDGAIFLSWEPISAASKYAVATRNGDGSYTTYTLDCTETAYAIRGLSNGRTYECLVQAYVDGRWSAFDAGDLVSARPMSTFSPDVHVTSVGNGTVTLSWDPIDGADRYAIAEYANGSYITYTFDCVDNSYTVGNIANGKEHAFLVQANVDGVWSSCTPYLHVYATPEGPTKPTPIAEVENDTVLLMWDPIPAATRYAIARYEGNGVYKTYTLDCTENSYVLSGLSTAGEYSFLVQANVEGAWSTFTLADHVTVYIAGTPIMGESQTSVDQMVRRYNAVGFTYPSSTYSSYGASTICDFCTILMEEANDEGVRAEVVFAQAMHETGWLQFGGDVQASQCNFAGIGATGGGNPGNSFADVRQGIRAQVQHLKAYASTDGCVHEIVDPRFGYVSRGCAPTVQSLGGKWAADNGYGSLLNSQISALLSS